MKYTASRSEGFTTDQINQLDRVLFITDKLEDNADLLKQEVFEFIKINSKKMKRTTDGDQLKAWNHSFFNDATKINQMLVLLIQEIKEKACE